MSLKRRILLAVLASCSAVLSEAQIYEAGDIVENFTFTDRTTGEPVNLYDLEDKVIFIEWFAYWCPFCKAAAADVGPNIADYYQNNNRNGVDYIHISANLEPASPSSTQQFIDFYGLDYVVEDFGRPVANRFAGGGQPIFAIINGVANSPSHQQWELVYSHLGYGNLTTPIQQFRSAIESVEPGVLDSNPPAISLHPISQNQAVGSNFTLTVTATSDETISYQWYKDNEAILGATSADLAITEAQPTDSGIYHVVATNTAGDTVSDSANVQIILSLTAYLESMNVPTDETGAEQDPDKDGASNVFEYFAETDPLDPSSTPNYKVSIGAFGSERYLQVEIGARLTAIGYALDLEFSSEIDFSEVATGVIVSQADNAEGPQITMFRAPNPIGSGKIFSRIAIREVEL